MNRNGIQVLSGIGFVIQLASWNTWFRDFVKGWLLALYDGFQRMKPENRDLVLANVGHISRDASVLKILQVFQEFGTGIEDKTRISECLDGIHELTDEVSETFQEFYSQILTSLDSVSSDERDTVISCCGAACNKMHAEAMFKKAWENTGELASFVEKLNETIGGGNKMYEILDDQHIRVKYPRCLCPLVSHGFVNTHNLCNCSASWIVNGFSASLKREVTVKKNKTALEGAEDCEFIIIISSK